MYVEIDKKVLIKELNVTISDKEKDKEYINKLNRTEDKVKYLRFIKRYTQKNSAKMIGITERHVKRIERCLKNVP